MDVKLPLYRLFVRLRDAGLKLGLEEYLSALKLVGFPLQDLDHLERLLRVLWVTSEDEDFTFTIHFKRLFASYAVTDAPTDHSDSSLNQVPSEQPTANTGEHRSDTSEEESFPSPTKASPNTTTYPVAPRRQGQKSFVSDASSSEQHFVLTPTFAPISERELSQNWKYLRSLEAGSASEEVDVPAMIREVSRRGFFTKVHYLPQRVSSYQVLMMIDQGGSMIPFRPLAQQIVKQAMDLKKVQADHVLYFHDLPGKNLYRDARLMQEVEEQEWIPFLKSKNTALIIISDAGAARGSFSDERVYETFKFYRTIAAKVQRIAWLNPVPRQRWNDCSAGFIQQFCPMFGTDREGMKNAIDHLLGKTEKGIL